MARASYRRRRDGIVEIVHRGRVRDVLFALGTGGIAVGLTVAMATAFAVYLAVAVPLLLGGALFLALRHFRPRRRAAPAMATPGLRLVSTQRGTVAADPVAGPLRESGA